MWVNCPGIMLSAATAMGGGNEAQTTLKQHRFEMHRSMSWIGPHDLWLAEPVDGKLQMPRDECKVIHGFSVSWRVGAPNPHIVQGSTVILRRL